MDLSELYTACYRLLMRFMDPGSRFALVWIGTSLAFAFALYVARPDARRVNFFRFCFPRHIWRRSQPWCDIAFTLANLFLKLTLVGALIISSGTWLRWFQQALEALFGPPGQGFAPHWGWTVLTTMLIALATDFALWVSHWLQHRVPWLWEFHKVHHSALVLTPPSAERMHPVDTVLGMTIGGLGIGLSTAILRHWLGPAAWEATAFGNNVVVVAFYAAAYHIRHSHLWLPLTGIWGRIFISPAHHQIHHSSDPAHFDKNIGLIFALWDWMAGTLVVPEKHGHIVPGIGNGEEQDYRGLWRPYLWPLVTLARRFRRSVPALHPAHEGPA